MRTIRIVPAPRGLQGDSSVSVMQKALRVFGPPGIQALLRTTLGYSGTQFSMPVVVAEWTLDPEGGHPPHPDPSLPGVAFAKVQPDLASVAKVQAISENTGRLQRQRGRNLEVCQISILSPPLPLNAVVEHTLATSCR